MTYSALFLDQSMTATGWAHKLHGDKAPTGGVFALPSWGEDQGPCLHKFSHWLSDMIWDRQVTHIAFEEPVDMLDHREEISQNMAKWGLPTLIELVAYDRGIPADNRLTVNISTWRTRFWGRHMAPKSLTKSARRSWLKQQSIDQCHARGWNCSWNGKPDHNVADAMGGLNEMLCCIDPVWASRDGPLFRRNELRVENEERANG